MSWLLAGAGALIAALTLVDFVWTTMSLRHAGPITQYVSRWLWLGFRLSGRALRADPLLGAAGPVILFGTLLGWVLLLWIAWLLIFLAGDNAVLVTPGMHPADFWGRVNFSGFTISTLGVGDLVPGGDGWQVLSALGALNGLIVITVGITYLLSVLSAVVQMRQLAKHITSLGPTPEEMLVRGWTGDGFGPLLGHLQSLTPQLLLNVQQQLAYPILHYFYSTEASTAAGPAIAVLDEAVTLLEEGVAPPQRPQALGPLRSGVDAMLDNLTPHYVEPADAPPAPPDLQHLRAAGIDTVGDAEFASAVERRAGRRQLLLAMVRHEGWNWQPLMQCAMSARSASWSR